MKYIKIFVILVWVIVIGGAVYFILGKKEICNVSISGKCYSQSNINTAKFSIPGNMGGLPSKINNPATLLLP